MINSNLYVQLRFTELAFLGVSACEMLYCEKLNEWVSNGMSSLILELLTVQACKLELRPPSFFSSFFGGFPLMGDGQLTNCRLGKPNPNLLKAPSYFIQGASVTCFLATRILIYFTRLPTSCAHLLYPSDLYCARCVPWAKLNL